VPLQIFLATAGLNRVCSIHHSCWPANWSA